MYCPIRVVSIHRGSVCIQRIFMNIHRGFVCIQRISVSIHRGSVPLHKFHKRLDIHFTSGGVVKVWYGAGDGTLHSRPSAPSHGLAGAGGPPRIVLITMNRKKICVAPNMKLVKTYVSSRPSLALTLGMSRPNQNYKNK